MTINNKTIDNLYDITCTPLGKQADGSTASVSSGPIRMLVVAENSSIATRKAVKWLQEFMPSENIVAIDVTNFVRITNPDSCVVVG